MTVNQRNGNGWKSWVIGILGSLVLLGFAGTMGWLVSKVNGFDQLAAERGERITRVERDMAAMHSDIVKLEERFKESKRGDR